MPSQTISDTNDRQAVAKKFHTIQSETPVGPIKLNQDSAQNLQSKNELGDDGGESMMITGVDADESYQQKVQASN